MTKEAFYWGASTAAFQIEGASQSDGKTLSIWDQCGTQDISPDHYHHFRQDVILARQMGLDAYRFSISWARIIPEEGKVNEKGLDFYRQLCGELQNANIRPIVTLYHWDLPQWAQDKGGWLWDGISDVFRDYVGIVRDALGDQVSQWITLDAPGAIAADGYLDGTIAPFVRCPENEQKDAALQLSKNLLLAHGKAVKALREGAKLTPRIGIAMDGFVFLPRRETAEEITAAREKTFPDKPTLRFTNWWTDTLALGKPCPELAAALSCEELEIISQPLDFLGVCCREVGGSNQAFPGMPRTATDKLIEPEALYWCIRFCAERYQLPILVTGNGMANIDFIMSDGLIHDQQRIEYMKGYLGSVNRALAECIPVEGYLYWSLMDGIAWTGGVNRRYGLIYVDYQTRKRYFKDSAIWYSQVIADREKLLKGERM